MSRHARAPRVLLLNPNSSSVITESLRATVQRLAIHVAHFETVQIDAAPQAIACPADHETVRPLVVKELVARAGTYDVAVIACHGDPGLTAARSQTDAPVLGIGDTSLRSAAATGSFAVLALTQSLVDRKWHQVHTAGAAHECVAVVPTGTTVEHGTAVDADLAPYLAAANTALAAGARLLVLGCAGMSALAARLATATGVPVLDPVAVTAGLAATVVAASPHTFPLLSIER